MKRSEMLELIAKEMDKDVLALSDRLLWAEYILNALENANVLPPQERRMYPIKLIEGVPYVKLTEWEKEDE